MVVVDGDPWTVLVWLDVYFAQGPFAIEPEESFHRQIDKLGFVYSRPSRKKKKCKGD